MTSGWFANGQESLSARLRRLRPPMSDAKYTARYDPPSRQESLLLEILKDIKAILETQDASKDLGKREKPWQEYQSTKGSRPSGPVQL